MKISQIEWSPQRRFRFGWERKLLPEEWTWSIVLEPRGIRSETGLHWTTRSESAEQTGTQSGAERTAGRAHSLGVSPFVLLWSECRRTQHWRWFSISVISWKNVLKLNDLWIDNVDLHHYILDNNWTKSLFCLFFSLSQWFLGIPNVTGGGGSKADAELMVHPDAGTIRQHRPLSASVSDETALRHIVIDGSNVAIR